MQDRNLRAERGLRKREEPGTRGCRARQCGESSCAPVSAQLLVCEAIAFVLASASEGRKGEVPRSHRAFRQSRSKSREYSFERLLTIWR